MVIGLGIYEFEGVFGKEGVLDLSINGIRYSKELFRRGRVGWN